MYVKMFNFWYFFWIFLSIACYVGLYLLLKNKSDKTKKIVYNNNVYRSLMGKKPKRQKQRAAAFG